MKEYSINTLYLAQISELGELKQFGQWIYYKAMFKKGCVFNYTDVHFSRRIGISISSARILRKFWLYRGWCRMDNGNLIFNSARNSVRREKWNKTTVKIYDTIEKTVKELYYQVIANKEKQFEFLKRISVATLNASSIKAQKWAVRMKGKFAGKLPETDSRFKISYKGLAKTFGCSEGKAYNIMAMLLKEQRIYVFKKQREVLIRNQSSVCLGIMKELNERSYVSGRSVVRNCCNEYIFR